jgi:hypothetical protein
MALAKRFSDSKPRPTPRRGLPATGYRAGRMIFGCPATFAHCRRSDGWAGPGQLRPERVRPARPRAAALRLRLRAAPLRAGGSPGGRCGRGRQRAAAAHRPRQNRPGGQGAEIGPSRGGTWRPVRSVRSRPGRPSPSQAGPLFRKISTGNGIGDTALHPDAVRLILARRVRMGGSLSRGSTGSARTRCTSASSPPPMTKVYHPKLG